MTAPHEPGRPTPQCRVRLLGALSVKEQGGASHAVTIPPGRAQSLFAYLVLQKGRPVTRDAVIAALWPNAEPERARRTLSDTLYRLRKALNADWLQVEGEMLAIQAVPHLMVDVWTFEDAIHRGDPQSLAQAVELYRGELLPGLQDEWLLAPRLAFHESYLDALETLARQTEEARDLGRAALYYRQLIQMEPYREAGYVGLMRVLAARRRLQEALQIYQQLVQILHQEMDTHPSAYAQELAAQLNMERELAAGAPDAPGLLQEPPFVGRSRQRALALRQLQALEPPQSHGSVVLIEGEPGMGKSRLLMHLLKSAAWRSLLTVHVRFPPEPGDNPYQPLVQALSPLWRSSRGPQLAAALTSEELAALGPLAPEWLAPAPPPEPAPSDAHTLLGHAWVELVRAMGDLSPWVLALDDVHWATPSVWDLLQALMPHLNETPCLLMLAYRRKEMEQHPAWALLRAWEMERPLHRLELGPLARDEVARLLPPGASVDVETVRAVTGGNPFYIQQALAGGVIAPQSLDEIIQKRLAHLPVATRQALEAAAILGMDIPFALWRDMLHISQARLTALADTLVARGWLHVQGHRYRFAHHLLQEAVLVQMSPDQRRRYHSHAADLLAAEDAADMSARARHLELAGRLNEAAQAYRSVARTAHRLHAYAEARDAYRRGLTLVDAADRALRRDLLWGLAQTLSITGDWADQATVLDELEQLIQTPEDAPLQLEVALHRARAAFQAGQYDEALARLAQVEAQARALENQAEIDLEVAMLRGDIHLRRSAYPEARRHLQEALALAQALGRRAEEGRALDGLAWAGNQQGQDAEQVFALYRQALTAQREAGDRLGEARTLLNLFTAQAHAGRWDQALTLADEVLAAQAGVHYRLGEAVTHQTLATTAAALGLYPQAAEHVELALAGFRSVNEQAGVVIALETRGVIAARQNDPEQAEADLRQALAQAQTLDIPIFIAFAQQDLGQFLYEQGRSEEAAPLLAQARTRWEEVEDALNAARCTALLGLIHLEQGRREQAHRLAEEGWRVFREDAPGGEDHQGWLLWLAQLWLGLGHETRARQLIQAAYTELQAQAQRIHDAAPRANFFHQAVYNRAIVELYDRLHGVQRTVQATLRHAHTGDPVSVNWTIHAPEDEAITNPGARRRFVLARLLREAKAQDALHADRDLAQALGVSRRTVIRDREKLRQQEEGQ